MKKNCSGGFSMVELVIVIAIIAVIAAITVPTYIKYVAKSKNAVCNTNTQALLDAFMMRCVEEGIDMADVDERYAAMDETVAESFKACKKKDGIGHIYTGFCPAGGETAAFIDAGGFLKITCSKHGPYTIPGTEFMRELYNLTKNDLDVYFQPKGMGSSIDSTAEIGPMAMKINQALSEIYGTNALDYTWKIIKLGNGKYDIYLAAEKIDEMTAGSYVDVTRYSTETGKYYSGQTKVVSHKETYGSTESVYNIMTYMGTLKNQKELD